MTQMELLPSAVPTAPAFMIAHLAREDAMAADHEALSAALAGARAQSALLAALTTLMYDDDLRAELAEEYVKARDAVIRLARIKSAIEREQLT